FELIELLLEDSLGLGKCVGRLTIKALLNNFCDRRVQALEKIFQLKLVLLQNLLVTAFDNCEACARQHARQGASERFINGANLREVSYFSRAAYIGSRRQ